MSMYVAPKYCTSCGGSVGFGPVTKPDGLQYESSDYGEKDKADQGHLCQNPECGVIGVLCVVIRTPVNPKS